MIKQLQLNESLNQWITSCTVIESNNFHQYVPQAIGFPEATPELFIFFSGHLDVYYGDQFYQTRKSCVFTYIDKLMMVVPSQSIHCIRITFRPLGVFPFVKLSGVSSSELTQSPVFSAKDLFGKCIRTLEQKLFDANEAGIIQLLTNFFHAKLNHKLSDRDHAVLNLNPSAAYAVDDLCKSLYISPRTLQRWFSHNMNISPKYYLRLRRFKNLVRDLSSAKETDYLNLAIKNGYYDQNHLIKEIKSFTDQRPSEISFDQYLSNVMGDFE